MTKSGSERTVFLYEGPYDGYELTITGPALKIWIPKGREHHRYAATDLECEGMDVYRWEGVDTE